MNHKSLIQNLYVIAGSTATGKSSLAIELAKHIGAAIINGDSRQVYNGLSIGAAQPTPDNKRDDGVWIIDGIEHYLYGHREIAKEYSVAEYQQEVFELLQLHSGANPSKKFIIVGGSGLFIDSVIYNYGFTDDALIEGKREDLMKLEVNELQKLISTEDLEKLNKSDRANPARLIRVIERGIPEKQDLESFDRYFLLELPREELLKRINLRTDLMFEAGIVGEVISLWKKYPKFKEKSLKSIGYQEFVSYFNGETDLDEVKELINIHTRQYAKRQKTWFKKNRDCKVVENLKNINKELNI